MTSRLKKRLGNLGVDTHNARANESFCLIGTPLPPLEKSKDTGEFVPLWKQDVRDEQGRRRLHGAFTGGFSAGYYNTVGSKEGWTPSTFVSSRNDRAKQKAAKPEDFMDEEDLQEIRDSRQFVDTTEEMELNAGAQQGSNEDDDSIAHILNASVLPAPKDSVGARILKKMGWKLGQGIGPRVSLRQRRMQDFQAQTGSRLTMDEMPPPEDEDEEAGKHTYASRDTPILIVPRKDNSHGVGYRPGMSLNESNTATSGSGGKVQSGPNISTGFGLGALNDADDDDLDVYDSGPKGRSHQSKVAYDFGVDTEESGISIGQKHGKRQRTTTLGTQELFNDGTPVLPGFVLSTKPVLQDRVFPLQDVPNGWSPNPQRLWEGKENASGQAPVGEDAWKRTITSDQRGSILGETPLPGAPKSVFDLMSKKDRERLQSIAAASASGTPLAVKFEPPTAPEMPPPPGPTEIQISRTDAHVAAAALKGYQPYIADALRHQRYTLYLHSQADMSGSTPPPLRQPNQRIETYNKELDDYAKSAQIFKPISGAMAGRFTSSSIVEHGPKAQEGLYTPDVLSIAAAEAKAKAEEEERQKKAKEDLTPKQNAAKLGMYGVMTREIEVWYPAKLLCKRFGVKDPNPEPAPEAESSAGYGFTEPTAGPSSTTEEVVQDDVVSPPTRDGPRDLNNIGLGEDAGQGLGDLLAQEKPSMDIFKAIFASDDEDSDDEGVEVKKEHEETQIDDPPPLPIVANPAAPEPIPTSSNEPVDPNTFKPTFVPRSERSKGKDKEPDGGIVKDKAQKKKKDKQKEKKRLVSFAMDEEVDGAEPPPVLDRPKKKKRKDKEKKQEDDDDSAMWVEKPAPEAVKQLVQHNRPPEAVEEVNAGRVGRKRAVDFM